VARIYLSPPDMSDVERNLLLEAFDSNWITPLGPMVDAFEAELAAYCGAPAAAALSSGTAALHLALLLAGVRPGDRVVVPTLTFVAPANAVRYCGAEVHLVDSERETWNLDPDLVDRVLTEADRRAGPVRAVVAVDLYGQCARLDRLRQVCDAHGAVLIEDAAEAIGATWAGGQAGTWGELGAFSFNGNKIITTGGGGALVGDHEPIARARYLAAQARRPVLHYEHDEVGFNYRLSNLLAAVGRGQLARLPDRIARRHAIRARYLAGLGGVDGVTFMPWDDRGRPNGWLTVVLLDDGFGATPAEVCAHLDTLDMEARPAWKPMHRQPAFADAPRTGGAVADEVYRRGLCLPSRSAMTDAEVDRVVEGVLGTPRRG
jgi:dTDP-4-amino-4,6-dideoxygalactose transaminase